MSLRLSHTQFSKYQQCGRSYKFYYVDKLRPTQPRSSLLFGTAIDKTLEYVLDNSKRESSTFKNEQEAFDYHWRIQTVGKKQEYLPTNGTILYGKKDFDEELLTVDDRKKFEELSGISYEDGLKLMGKRLAIGHASMSMDENKQANILFWLSMYRKGSVMIAAFKTEVLPKLTKVHSVQEQISLKNQDGDEVTGLVDLVAEVDGQSEPIILDIKTSALAYENDAHLTAPQLVLYLHALRDKYKTDKVGFIVLGKNLNKNRTKICDKCGFDGTGGRHKTCNAETNNTRCNGNWIENISPSCPVQLITGSIPKQTEDLVLENIDQITQAIKAGHFTGNLNTCFNSFGGACDYVNYCYKGKTDGLSTP